MKKLIFIKLILSCLSVSGQMCYRPSSPVAGLCVNSFKEGAAISIEGGEIAEDENFSYLIGAGAIFKGKAIPVYHFKLAYRIADGERVSLHPVLSGYLIDEAWRWGVGIRGLCGLSQNGGIFLEGGWNINDKRPYLSGGIQILID